jgi:hypothetical protein
MMKFGAMLKKFMASAPLFLLLAPVYVILHLEKVFHTQINYRFVMAQIFIMLIASVVFILSCILLLRDKKKACLVAFILMLAWFYLGMLKNALEEYYPNDFLSSYKYYLPLSAIVIFSLIYQITNFKGSLNRLFLFINVLWLIFITLDIILLAFSGIVNHARQNRYAITLPIHDLENSQKPDIYYIVFDSYSGNSILKKMGFDNYEIEKNLTESGFKIVSGSRSNYNMTPFSIASTFNMKYLDGVDTKKKYFLNDYYSAVNAVKWNGLIPWLVKNGYDFDAFSIFDFPGHPSINKNYDIWNIDGLFLQNNFALKVYKDISWNFKLKPFNRKMNMIIPFTVTY